MNLSEVKRILDREGIHLTKSLGQNFLHDRQQLSHIVSEAEVETGDSVLEIGPGLGPLTDRLLDAGASVLAVEKDRRLVEVLKQRFASQSRLSVLHADSVPAVCFGRPYYNRRLAVGPRLAMVGGFAEAAPTPHPESPILTPVAARIQ